jgi:5-enolpyruvylshikimate-3-phosphate synthase
MKWRIRPCGPLHGAVSAPPSKSHTLRALLFGLMGEGVIRNPLSSPDTDRMIAACRQLGATIGGDPLRVCGALRPPSGVIDAGNSGIVLRFIGALAALTDDYCIITGDASVRENRPIAPLVDGLRQLGAFADGRGGGKRAPLIVKGPLRGGFARIDGADSQPVSALLIALSFLPGTHHLEVTNPGEQPWIDLTLSWLQNRVTHDNYTRYTIEGGAPFAPFDYTVPGDFSSAAYPIAAGLVTEGDVRVANLDFDDPQGDKALLPLLGNLPEQIDCNRFIDALPILAVLGCYGERPLHLHNAAIARQKESDRIATIAGELRKMGGDLDELPDGLTIRPARLRGAPVESHGDHRIALSLAVAALGASGETEINNVACVAKTYQTFAQDMQKLGVDLECDSLRPSGVRQEPAGQGAR